MLGSEILDVAIGLIFVYILMSIICSAVREGIEAFMKTRASYLEHGIRELLHDKPGRGLARDVFRHPLISGLFSASEYEPGPNRQRPGILRRGVGLPSYIPSKSFAMALMDIAARGPAVNRLNSSHNARPLTVESIRQNILNMQNARIQRVMLTALDSAQGDLEKVQANLEAWYDSSMDRVSGWYKRSSQWIILAIALVVTVAMNVDTLAIVRHLHENENARAAAVAAAQNAQSGMTYNQANENLAKLNLPIGWVDKDGKPTWPDTFTSWRDTFRRHVGGWLLTAVAATLGAPFWFDVLNKVMVIRSTVKPREKSPEEGSEDRQNPKPALTVNGRSGSGTTPSPSTPPRPAGGAVDADDVDGCEVDFKDAEETTDEQLPAAEGGVE